METIKLQNLSIGYQTKHGVRVVASNINGDIRSGELTCLLGSNGIGKSTLLRTLSAFQPLIGGEIFIENREITRSITMTTANSAPPMRAITGFFIRKLTSFLAA